MTKRLRQSRVQKRYNRRFNRRHFLGGLGASAAMVPFIPMLHSEGMAENGEFPCRVILAFSANGTIHENWVPNGTETNWTLSPILAPLQAHHDLGRITVLDGIENLRTGPGDGHQKGMGLLWTGNELLAGDLFEGGGNAGTVGWGGGISVDQEVANSLAGQTAFNSLEFGVQTRGATVWSRMVYAGSNEPIPPEDDPQAMFDRLFADLDVDTAELDRIKAERRSVIDLVKADLDALNGRYGTEDQRKVEAHLDAIREIERRNDLATPACEAPAAPAAMNFDDNANYPAVSRMQIDQLVMAMACDLTRVASLQWSRSVSNTRFDWLPTPVSEGHHELSHLGDGDGTAIDKLTRINTWYAGEFAYLLDQLAAIPEGNGTMLDNTLVVWGNELGRGNSHSRRPIPFVLAGGAGGRINSGRFLSFNDLEHNRVLVSILQAMGLTNQSFGNMDPGTGPVPGLLA